MYVQYFELDVVASACSHNYPRGLGRRITEPRILRLVWVVGRPILKGKRQNQNNLIHKVSLKWVLEKNRAIIFLLHENIF